MSRARTLELWGACLFASGWLLLAAHGTQSFWSGDHVLYATAQTQAAAQVTDLVGGSDFAFHQKSKSGDIPKVLALPVDAARGSLVILTKDWNQTYDMRWSPTLMQQDAQRITYASGQRMLGSHYQPQRLTRRVARTPLGNFTEDAWDLAPKAQYLLLLPQNNSWRGDAYSVEIRQRTTENHLIFLFAAFASLVSGLMLMFSQRKRRLYELDPIKLARTYQTLVRIDEANEVLQRALKTHPDRYGEIRDAMVRLKASQLI